MTTHTCLKIVNLENTIQSLRMILQRLVTAGAVKKISSILNLSMVQIRHQV